MIITMTYYIKDSILPVDEDEMWEFKAHRNFSSDEVPAWHADGTKVRPQYAMHEFYKLKNANRTRQPISRNLCGFLNAGKGGTILIGVLDNGKVVGMALNALQKDHLLLSLEDALRRFNPRVPNDFVKVAFIPVIDNKEELQDVANPKICEPSWEGFMPTLYVVEVRIAALHPKLRTSAIASILNDMMKDYKSPVVRLSWPAFTSEDGNLFCRVLNSLIKFTEDEITQFNYCQTMDFLLKELSLMETDDDVKKNRHFQFLLPGVTLSKASLESILNYDEEEEMTQVAEQQVNDSDDEPASPLSTNVPNHVPTSDLSFDSTAENGFNPNISSNPDVSVSESDMSCNIFVASYDSLEDVDEAGFVPMPENNSTNSTMKTDEMPDPDFVRTSENISEHLSTLKTTDEMSEPDSEADFVLTSENNSKDLLNMKTDEMPEPDFVHTSENNHENLLTLTATDEMSESDSEADFVPTSENNCQDLSTMKTDEVPEPGGSSPTTTLSKDKEELIESDNFDAETPEDVLKSDFATPAFVAEMDEHELDAMSSVSSDMSEQHLTSSFLQLFGDEHDDLNLPMIENRPVSPDPSMLFELEPRPKSGNN
ncbi:hypothetical protein B566_EDAN005436 [Ephemera danica]|nr:hypothetical protein B566_EDAN005436 [Ephemera danica]